MPAVGSAPKHSDRPSKRVGGRVARSTYTSLDELTARLIECERCPRLVAWRQQVADEKRAAFRSEEYWGRPVPGFGDPQARLLVIGLAPAAHGGNRTGRIFTGDRSGDLLFSALHSAGFSNQPTSVSRADGLRLKGAYVVAAVRCAPPQNKPLTVEIVECEAWLVEEISLLPQVRSVLALGSLAFARTLEVAARLGWSSKKPRARFAHGAVVDLRPTGPTVVASYHPSQQNTFTGRLTPAMFDEVVRTARYFALPA